MRYFCTLFDKNYLTRGLAMYKSLIKHNPSIRLWVLALDDESFEILTKMDLKNVQLIKLSEIEDSELLEIKKSRTLREYYWTFSSALPLYLLQHNPKIDVISYLDADLLFYSSVDPIFKEIGPDNIMIIPHRFPPWKAKKAETAGIFNVSMVTFRNNSEGKQCLRWWRDRCVEWCFYRVEEGKWGDQKYLEDFPKLFKKVHILRHLGSNLAHWNAAQYKITNRSGKIFVNNDQLIFFHFQGFEVYNSNVINYGPVDIFSRFSRLGSLLYEPYYKTIISLEELVKEKNAEYQTFYSQTPGLKKIFAELVKILVRAVKKQIRQDHD